MTLVVEVLYLLVYSEQRERFEIVSAQFLMSFGILALIVLVRAWVSVRRFENAGGCG